MTVETQGGQTSYAGLATGTEDFDPTDLSIPRLKIMHVEGKFENPETEEIFDYLDCIILCCVKQRVMFNPVYDPDQESEGPWCKSNDFKFGFPQKEFPWDQSNRTRADLEVTPVGNETMSCQGCNFSAWGPKNPKTGKSKPPMCNELHTYALLYHDPQSGHYLPALLTIKSSSLKASNSYLQPFATADRPLYMATTRLTLTQQKRGMINYSVLKFQVTGQTDESTHLGYSSQSFSFRDMLRSEPKIFDEDGNEQQAPAQSPASAAPAPVAQASEDSIPGEVVTQAPPPPPPPAQPSQRRARPDEQAAALAPAAQPQADDDDGMPF